MFQSRVDLTEPSTPEAAPPAPLGKAEKTLRLQCRCCCRCYASGCKYEVLIINSMYRISCDPGAGSAGSAGYYTGWLAGGDIYNKTLLSLSI